MLKAAAGELLKGMPRDAFRQESLQPVLYITSDDGLDIVLIKRRDSVRNLSGGSILLLKVNHGILILKGDL